MENFTPVSALLGGALIGISASLFLLMNGRMAGVSGILAGIVPPRSAEQATWRVLFLGGLVVGVLIHRFFIDTSAAITIDASVPTLLVGGVLVGIGTRVGAGCTSGHGVCGISRLSVRSLVATLTFMLVAVVTVYIQRHVMGGS